MSNNKRFIEVKVIKYNAKGNKAYIEIHDANYGSCREWILKDFITMVDDKHYVMIELGKKTTNDSRICFCPAIYEDIYVKNEEICDIRSVTETLKP